MANTVYTTQVVTLAEYEGLGLDVTQLVAIPEYEGLGLDVTQLIALVEYAASGLNVTQIVVLVEFEDQAQAEPLAATLVKYLRVQAGRQSAFDSPAAIAVALPAIGDALDAQEEHVAPWDSGTATPLVIVDKIAQYATFTLQGTLFFETLALLLEAGFGELLPTGEGPYTFAGGAVPGLPSEPIPYTYRMGGNMAGVTTGSMIQVQDSYLQSLHLEMSVESKAVQYAATFFGRFYDDNNSLGYQPAAVGYPPTLEIVNGLRGALSAQDAGEIGGAFDSLAAFNCDLLGWAIDLETGLRPAWSGDNNSLSYCGVRLEAPLGRYIPILRTNLDTYARVLTKAQQRAYQELQIDLYGEGSQSITLQFTGRWLPKIQAHERERGEVVLKPTFVIQTPATQTASPHWAGWEIVSDWEGL